MGSATLTVVVMDINDNSPTIPVPWEIRVPESECRSTGGHSWGTMGTWGGVEPQRGQTSPCQGLGHTDPLKPPELSSMTPVLCPEGAT